MVGRTPLGVAGDEPVPRVLVVEDDANVRFGICRYLAAQGVTVHQVESCGDAIAYCLEGNDPEALVLDWRLPDGDAFTILEKLKEANARIPFVLVTAHGSVELAVRAMREGATDVLTKPVHLPTLLGVIGRMVETERDARKHSTTTLKAQVAPFVGTGRVARELSELAAKVAASDRPVLIVGETGTGTTLLARWLHQNGARCKEPFVEVNCAGLSRELVESELFGRERGAHTGAELAKLGLVESAHRGTLFLDEVGDLDPSVQPKLLKVLEDKRFRRVGDVRERAVDARIVAATQHELGQAVRDGLFRGDLFYRLSTVTLTLPPLRERREDLPAIIRELLATLGAGATLELANDAEAKLLEHDWPGNVRELKNVLERAVIFASGRSIRSEDVRFDVSTDAPRAPRAFAGQTLDDMERAHIEAALRDAGGHVERAAVSLGIPRSTLYHKLKRLREGDKSQRR